MACVTLASEQERAGRQEKKGEKKGKAEGVSRHAGRRQKGRQAGREGHGGVVGKVCRHDGREEYR